MELKKAINLMCEQANDFLTSNEKILISDLMAKVREIGEDIKAKVANESDRKKFDKFAMNFYVSTHLLSSTEEVNCVSMAAELLEKTMEWLEQS